MNHRLKDNDETQFSIDLTQVLEKVYEDINQAIMEDLWDRGYRPV
jgi:hypothetical protein